MRLLPRNVKPSQLLITEAVNEIVQQQATELEELREELDILRPLQQNQITNLSKLLTGAWLKPTTRKADKLFFDDPLWGQTCVDEELTEIFFHPLIQRLNHIKQLSFAYLRFPNATHSRLAHSLGTCRNLEASLTTMFRNNFLYGTTGRKPIPLDPIERRELLVKAKAAALLHDVGHAPFGHTLDKLIGYYDGTRPLKSPDKHYSRKYYDDFLRAHLPTFIDADNLAEILGPDQSNLTGWDTLIADLVASELDADRMDFLVRDAHMTGLLMGLTSTEALIERMCPFQEGEQIFLTFDSSCLPYAEDFLIAREKMYALCYEHPSKLAAERIFCRLVENLMRDHSLSRESILLLTDEQILALLGLAAVTSNESAELLSALLQNVEFAEVLEVELTSTNPLVSKWNTSRHLPRMGHWAYIDSPTNWEKEIAAASGIGEPNKWRVLVSVPDQRTGIPNESSARILERVGSGYRIRRLFDIQSSTREKLKEEHKPRGKIRVFADSRIDPKQRAEIQKAATAMFGAA